MDDSDLAILLIDNYDSFTFNLYQLIGSTGARVEVIRNDDWSSCRGKLRGYTGAVISPGPGRPQCRRDLGISQEVLACADLPIFGVCLGHQGIGHLYGARVELATAPMHGRVSRVHHAGGRLFEGVPETFDVVRYHSLVVSPPLPPALEPMAWAEDGVVMALRALDRPLWGVQFHPESVSSRHGSTIVRNFLGWCRQWARRHSHCSRLRTGPSREPPAPQPSTGSPSKRRLRVVTRRLTGSLDCEAAFEACFHNATSAFWLDSASLATTQARFSYLGDGSGPLAQTLTYDAVGGHPPAPGNTDIFTRLRTGLDVEIDPPDVPFDFIGGYVGYLGYELNAEGGAPVGHASPYPDARMLFADRLIAVDHRDQQTWLVHVLDASQSDATAVVWFDWIAERLHNAPTLTPLRPVRAAVPARFTMRHTRAAYVELIRQCQEAIRQGESYQLCLTNTAHCAIETEPWQLYRALRACNPAPYAAYLRGNGVDVLCSSPERFLRIGADGRMEAKPIKGTVARGINAAGDARQHQWLAESAKDRAENRMIVDLLRNDLGKVGAWGSIQVPHLMAIESYETVHQMVSTITGRLASDISPVTAVQAAYPGGSMTGAPKLRAMALLDALEGGPRGVYSGAIGYFSLSGAVDLNITIRTLVVDPGGVSFGAGGAITWLSNPAAEYEEMLLKARAVARAVGLLYNGHGDALDG